MVAKLNKKDFLFMVYKVGDSSVMNVNLYRKTEFGLRFVNNRICYESYIKEVKKELLKIYEMELKYAR
jgi:hypothetical protein